MKGQRPLTPKAFTALRCMGSEVTFAFLDHVLMNAQTSTKKEESMISKLESSLDELNTLYARWDEGGVRLKGADKEHSQYLQ